MLLIIIKTIYRKTYFTRMVRAYDELFFRLSQIHKDEDVAICYTSLEKAKNQHQFFKKFCEINYSSTKHELDEFILLQNFEDWISIVEHYLNLFAKNDEHGITPLSKLYSEKLTLPWVASEILKLIITTRQEVQNFKKDNTKPQFNNDDIITTFQQKTDYLLANIKAAQFNLWYTNFLKTIIQYESAYFYFCLEHRDKCQQIIRELTNSQTLQRPIRPAHLEYQKTFSWHYQKMFPEQFLRMTETIGQEHLAIKQK